MGKTLLGVEGVKIGDLFQTNKTVLSLEVFPPKKESGLETIYQTLQELEGLSPDFVSITYGAGGSGGCNATLKIAKTIKERYGIEPLHHLTCVNNGQKDVAEILQEMKKVHVENVLALRGDLPETGEAVPDFCYAKDLVAAIKADDHFSVGAACYPEGHISQAIDQENYQHLLEKEQAGADFFISQLFFDNDCFYRMLEGAGQAGVTKPIVAGIMPILSKAQVQKMIFMCGSSLPSKLIKLIHRYGEDPVELQKASLDYAWEQMSDLIAHGVDGVHLYTMNRPEIALKTFDYLRGERH